jgi:tetratricopeptide (TPR) repeat protein
MLTKPMIKYSKQSLQALSEVGVGNVLSSDVYVIGFTGIFVEGSEMTRVQLLRARDVEILSVDFRVSGGFSEADVHVSKFVSVGADQLSCEIALGSVRDIACLGVETNLGIMDYRGEERVIISLDLPDVGDSFLSKNFINYCVFPEISVLHWMCTCGRINACEDALCSNCGARYSTISEFVDKGVEKVVCEQYGKKYPIAYNVALTFEENLNKYVASVHRDTLLGEGVILDCLDVEAMKSDYGTLVEKILVQSVVEKKKKKKYLIAGASLVSLLVIGYVLSMTVFANFFTYIRANDLFENGEYASAGELFDKLGEYKDSASKGLEAKYHVSLAKMGTGDFDVACTFFERYNVLDSPLKYKECIYAWAKSDASKGMYLVAADRLKKVPGYLDSNELVSSYEYDHAIKVEGDELYEESVIFFYQLRGYKDAEKRFFYNLYQIAKKQFVQLGVPYGVAYKGLFEYSIEDIWDGLRAHGYELSITHDDVFWDVVLMGKFQNSAGYFLRRYTYKESIWISYNLSAPSFDYFVVEDNTIMACDEDNDLCKQWLSIQFTSENAITVYNWHDKKTYKLKK